MKILFRSILLLCLITSAASPDDLKTQVDQYFRPLLEWKPKCALVIGVVENGNQHVFSYGQMSHDNPQKPDGDTVFEIGSITKVFTAILLSDMVLKGEVNLEDSIKKYLPDSVTMPNWKARDITLHDLVCHISGLPGLPSNMKQEDAVNPFANYSVENLYEFLNQVECKTEPGTKYAYSESGFGLLGHLLERISNSNYETLLASRLTKPLGMKDTVITFNSDIRSRVAQGYERDDTPIKNWDLAEALVGAGAIRSTVNDIMIFLRANMEIDQTSLTPAMKFSHQAHLPKDKQVNQSICLGWHISYGGNYRTPFISKGGETGGYRGFLGFNKEKQIGVVAMINYSVWQMESGVKHLMSVLSGSEAYMDMPEKTQKISVAPSILDAYVGQYELPGKVIVLITKFNNRLYVRTAGGEIMPAFPVSETVFFAKRFQAEITFCKNDQGKVTHFLLHQGLDHKAMKIK